MSSENILPTLQIISIVVGISVGVMSLGKSLQENGLLLTVKSLCQIVMPVLFLKYIILVATEFELIMPVVCGFTTVFAVLAIVVKLLSRDLHACDLWDDATMNLALFLIFIPAIVTLVNAMTVHDKGLQGAINNFGNLNIYTQALLKDKVHLSDYTYMGNHIELSTIYFLKGAEIWGAITCFYRGLRYLWNYPDCDTIQIKSLGFPALVLTSLFATNYYVYVVQAFFALV